MAKKLSDNNNKKKNPFQRQDKRSMSENTKKCITISSYSVRYFHNYKIQYPQNICDLAFKDKNSMGNEKIILTNI